MEKCCSLGRLIGNITSVTSFKPTCTSWVMSAFCISKLVCKPEFYLLLGLFRMWLYFSLYLSQKWLYSGYLSRLKLSLGVSTAYSVTCFPALWDAVAFTECTNCFTCPCTIQLKNVSTHSFLEENKMSKGQILHYNL